MQLNRICYLVLALILLAGCTENDVDIVKGGTMNGYQTNTIGNTFDYAFSSPKWTAFKSEKGERIVEFTGTISESLEKVAMNIFLQDLADQRRKYGDMYGAALSQLFVRIPESDRQVLWEMAAGETEIERMENTVLMDRMEAWTAGSPVVFQWIVSPDGKTIGLSYIEGKGWDAYKDTFILDMIYR